MRTSNREQAIAHATEHAHTDALREAEIARGGPLPDLDATQKEIRSLTRLDSVRGGVGPLPNGFSVFGDQVSYPYRTPREKHVAEQRRALKPTFDARRKYRERAIKATADMERLDRAGSWHPSQGKASEHAHTLRWAHESPDLDAYVAGVVERQEAHAVDHHNKRAVHHHNAEQAIRAGDKAGAQAHLDQARNLGSNGADGALDSDLRLSKMIWAMP